MNAEISETIGATILGLGMQIPRPQTAHKLQKIVDMNVDISETIKDRELGSQI